MLRTGPLCQQLLITLDSGVAFEALILNRWSRMPEGRREEWLRRLLVQGFQAECGALNAIESRGNRSESRPQASAPETAPRPELVEPRQDTSPAEPIDELPGGTAEPPELTFADLRKVIG